MNNLRRSLLKAAGASAGLAAALAAGLLKPVRAIAAESSRAAFAAKEAAAALQALGVSGGGESADIVIKAPEIAENGAVVPVDIVSNIPGTSSLVIIIDKNPFPLSARFSFANGAQAEVSVRLKFAQTSLLKVVARAGDKFYTAQREVKVTIGGCG